MTAAGQATAVEQQREKSGASCPKIYSMKTVSNEDGLAKNQRACGRLQPDTSDCNHPHGCNHVKFSTTPTP